MVAIPDEDEVSAVDDADGVIAFASLGDPRSPPGIKMKRVAGADKHDDDTELTGTVPCAMKNAFYTWCCRCKQS